MSADKMYKKGIKAKVRFKLPANFSSQGEVSMEDLFDLGVKGIPVIDEMAVAVQEEFESSGRKSFLVKKSRKDTLLKLKLDILVDILETLVTERDVQIARASNSAHNKKIDTILAKKEEEQLENMSTEELLAMRRS